MKSMNMGIWVVVYGQTFFMLKQNFQKNKVATGKTPFFVIVLFHSICHNIGFIKKYYVVNHRTFN